MPGFKELLISAKADDAEALQKIVNMYQRLAARKSYVDGKFNNDLYQLLLITIWRCIRTCRVDYIKQAHK